MTLASPAPRICWPVYSLEVAWVAQASRPAAGLLLCALGTSYQATISGTAYGTNGKPTIGRSEGAASADGRRAGLGLTGEIGEGKGLKEKKMPNMADALL